MKSKSLNLTIGALFLAFCATQVQAADVIKTTGADLSAGTSWTGGTAPGPGDVATWNNVSIPGGTFTLGSTAGTTTTWGGMKVTAAAAAIVLTGGATGQTLDFGASGITAGSKNITLGDTTANTPTVNVSADQTWTINLKIVFGGANLTVGSGVTSGGWTINLNNASTTNPQLDFNGGTAKVYDLTKAKLTGIGYLKLTQGTLKLGGANDFDGSINQSGSTTCVFSTLANAGTASSFGDGNALATTPLVNFAGNSTLQNTGAGGATDRSFKSTAASAINLTLDNDGTGALQFNGTDTIGGANIGTLSLKGDYAADSNVIAQPITATTIDKVFDASNWTLTGANTVGSVSVKKGILELGNAAAAGSATITMDNSGAELRIGGGLTITNNVTFGDKTGGGSRVISVTSATPATYSGEITISEEASTDDPPKVNYPIIDTAAGATLTVNGKVTSGVAGATGLTKRGAGTLILSTPETDFTYAGEFRLQQGTLRLDTKTGTGPFNATLVDTVPGVLAGTGTVRGAATFSSGSLVSPGNTAGAVATLNFTSDLTINAASGYTVDVTSATACDMVNVTGTLACGGTITFNPVGHTLALGNSYDVADAATITGTPTISPASPGEGLAWDLSQFNTTGVISVVEAAGYDTWAAQITNPADRDRTDDPDGDGFTNLQEYLFGTSPIAGNAALTTTEKSGSNLIIRWSELVTGGAYALKQSATLNNDWVTSTGTTVVNDGTAIGDYQPKKATVAIGTGSAFFRVEGAEN